MFETSVFLNLQYFKRDSYIRLWMSGRHCLHWRVHGDMQRKAEEVRAVAHLAIARSQKSRAGILGLIRMNWGSVGGPFFYFIRMLLVSYKIKHAPRGSNRMKEMGIIL